MKSDSILPPMSPSTWLQKADNMIFVNNDSIYGHDGFDAEKCNHYRYNLLSNPKYNRKDLCNVKDFNLSFEYTYGKGENSSKIVSKKVRDLFLKNSLLTQESFVPVEIID